MGETIAEADHFTVKIANYIGDASLSVTGSLAAGMEGMDLLGCVTVGFVTALGGGTIRCMFTGMLPVFWMVHYDEYVLCVVVSALTFALWPQLSRSLRLTSTDEWVFWTDTLGLAVFASTGAFSGSTLTGDKELNFLACASCGMFTATFGGLTRDILIGRPPRILYSHLELYALPAFIGGCATTAVIRFQNTLVMEAILLGTCVTALLRVIAQNYGMRLPTFPAEHVFKIEARPRDAAAALARQESEASHLEVDVLQSEISTGASSTRRSFIV